MPILLLLLLLFLGNSAAAQDALSLDGVAIGMDYGQVLQARGRPQAIRVEGELTQLLFAAPSPGRREGTAVWFHSDKAVFVTGYDLSRGGEPLFLYGMEGPVLGEAFGKPEPLNVFSRWFPQNGLVLGGYLNQWPLETVTSPLGLRDLSYPFDWYESRSTGEEPRRWSRSEPWMDDEILTWLAQDVELGMAEEKARKLARGEDVTYEGGFVRAIHHPTEALLSHHVGYHDFSTEFIVGEEPVALGLDAKAPPTGWYSPARGGRVRMQAGKVVEIELRLEGDALFSALSELGKP